MEKYDLIVIGSGAGMSVAANALGEGLRVALVEHGPLGGTCLNTGCIPSKILIHPADVIRDLQEARRVGVVGSIQQVDFPHIMDRMRRFVDSDRQAMERGVLAAKDLKWYGGTGEFISDYTLKVGEETITAPKILISSGSRALVPDIPGLGEMGFLDNTTVLQLKRLPGSIIIMGGGYIACEYGHFFSALGAQATIIGRNPRLLKGEEPEISDTVMRKFSRYARIYTGYEAVQAGREGHQKFIVARNVQDGKTYKFTAD